MIFLDAIMLWISNWGIALLIVLTLFTKNKKFIETAVCTILLTFGITSLLKEIVMRPRPFIVGAATLIGIAPEGWGFPSMHAAISFALATILFLHKKKLCVLAVILAGLIAYSRVYIGVHYWSDIIVGAMLGVFIAYGAYGVMRYFEARQKRKNT